MVAPLSFQDVDLSSARAGTHFLFCLRGLDCRVPKLLGAKLSSREWVQAGAARHVAMLSDVEVEVISHAGVLYFPFVKSEAERDDAAVKFKQPGEPVAGVRLRQLRAGQRPWRAKANPGRTNGGAGFSGLASVPGA
jgi:hypothetical protein